MCVKNVSKMSLFSPFCNVKFYTRKKSLFWNKKKIGFFSLKPFLEVLWLWKHVEKMHWKISDFCIWMKFLLCHHWIFYFDAKLWLLFWDSTVLLFFSIYFWCLILYWVQISVFEKGFGAFCGCGFFTGAGDCVECGCGWTSQQHFGVFDFLHIWRSFSIQSASDASKITYNIL